MEKVYPIPIRMERDIVFKRMHIYETQPNYDEFLTAYNELAEEIPKLVDARGIYVLKKPMAARRCIRGFARSAILYT